MRSMTGAAYLEHFGVKGMHWGVRRDPETGVRPIAQKLEDSKFGRMANKNANRRMSRQTFNASQKRGQQLMDAAMHNSTRIVELHSGQREPTLMNGRQFVDHLINGGLIDLNKTRVFEPAGRGHPDDIYRQVA